jgi:ankyrin repeat protein
LLQSGAELNVENDYGFTPLHLACIKGHVQVVQLLVQHGALKYTNMRHRLLEDLQKAAREEKRKIKKQQNNARNVEDKQKMAGKESGGGKEDEPKASQKSDEQSNGKQQGLQNIGAQSQQNGSHGSRIPVKTDRIRNEEDVANSKGKGEKSVEGETNSTETAKEKAKPSVTFDHRCFIKDFDVPTPTPENRTSSLDDKDVASGANTRGMMSPPDVDKENYSKNNENKTGNNTETTKANKTSTETKTTNTSTESSQTESSKSTAPESSDLSPPTEKMKSVLTPLHLAIQYERTAVACMLVESGADVNARDEDGYTALYVAAIGGYAEVVEALVDAGADCNVQVQIIFTHIF